MLTSSRGVALNILNNDLAQQNNNKVVIFVAYVATYATKITTDTELVFAVCSFLFKKHW